MLKLPRGSDDKESACNAGDPCSVPGLGKYPGEGNGNPLSILAWRIPWTEEPGELLSVHGVSKSQTQLRDFHFHSLPLSDTQQHMSYMHLSC